MGWVSGLMVIRSPTGTGGVGNCLNGKCRIITSVNRIHSLPSTELSISIRRSFTPGCTVVGNGRTFIGSLGGGTSGSSCICLTASPSERKRTVD